MKSFSTIVKNDQISKKCEQKVVKYLTEAGLKYQKDNPDIVIVLGGDGSFLNAVNTYKDILDSVKFVGIHTGTLGFYTDYQLDEIDTFLSDLINGNLSYECKLPLLSIDLIYQDHIEKETALNEIRVENTYFTQIIDVSIDGVKLQTYRGNGLMVATTSGTSAYNRSLGGALIDHNVVAMEMTEIIAIHHNAYRSLGSSLVLDKNRTIEFESSFEESVVGLDNRLLSAKGLQKIVITTGKIFITIARSRKDIYFEKLKRCFIH